MKQLLQHIRTGQSTVADVPAPQTGPGKVLVHTAASLVSAGTERMVVDFAAKNLLQKARSRPDLVSQTMDKVQREGLLTTLEAVQNRLDRPIALGYSCAGVVIEVGADVSPIKVDDRVACAGAGYAVHAEAVSIPKNLVVKLPHNVDFEAAAFTTLGAIALQGIRLAGVKLGEIVAVIGTGLLGQLALQMLKAAGCIVIGLDIQPQRAELARQLGADAVATSADELESLAVDHSSGYGLDAVLITADTKSNQPVEVAGQIARKKGVVVAVGAVGMNIPRQVYYEKELDFRISTSYGPGRYDPEYEEKGHDYPYAYVRWTEQRNMQAFVQLLAEGKVNVKPLISHRFPVEQAPRAYDLITGKSDESFLGILLTYPDQPDLSRKVILSKNTGAVASSFTQFTQFTPHASRANLQQVTLGLLGAGNFATAILLPAIKKAPDIDLVGICTATGLSGRHAGDKFGFRYCATDQTELLNDPAINTIAIATRHHLHAGQVIAALEAGKHIFVEKPLCLTAAELQAIISSYNRIAQNDTNRKSKIENRKSKILLVGFNRRFAPMAAQLKEFFSHVHEPLMMHYRVNAGYIPPNHWVHDPEQGGGRIIGEVCHFVDFLTFVAGAKPVQVQARALPNQGRYHDDNVVITIEFANNSLGTITYLANGDKAFPKERVEVFGGRRAAVLDDFRRLELVQNGRKKVSKSRLRQDKGHRGEWEAFVSAVKNGAPSPIPWEEVVATTLTTFAAVESLQREEAVDIWFSGSNLL